MLMMIILAAIMKMLRASFGLIAEGVSDNASDIQVSIS